MKRKTTSANIITNAVVFANQIQMRLDAFSRCCQDAVKRSQGLHVVFLKPFFNFISSFIQYCKQNFSLVKIMDLFGFIYRMSTRLCTDISLPW